MNINVIFLILFISILYFIFFNFHNLKNNNNIDLFDNSNQNRKVIVFIPIRNREKELTILLNRLEKIFKKQNLDYKCYILVQSDKKKFNKGKLINSGFNEAINDNFSDNLIFHDVDVYPKFDNIINYFHNNKKTIRHPYGHLIPDPYLRSGKIVKHETLSSIFMIDKNLFKKINGFSNHFWGWGGEDTDLEHRALTFKIPIDRSKFLKRPNKFIEDDISGNKTIDPRKMMNMKLKTVNLREYLKNKNNIYKDGLLNCKYKVLKRIDNYANNPKYVRLLIDI